MKKYQNTLIAHRGCHGKEIVENTLEAFQMAVSLKVPIELDVQFSLDQQVVVFHDADTKRLTGQSYSVEKTEYSVLRSLSIKKGYIPLLKEVLELVHGRVPLLIEIKRGHHYKRLCQQVYELLKEYSGKVWIQSFDVRVIYWWKKKTSYDAGLLISGDISKQNMIYYYLVHSLWILQHILKVDFVSIDFLSLPSSFVTKLREQKIPIFTWTIEEEWQLSIATEYADYFIVQEHISFH